MGEEIGEAELERFDALRRDMEAQFMQLAGRVGGDAA
jgi:hypothetical protein